MLIIQMITLILNIQLFTLKKEWRLLPQQQVVGPNRYISPPPPDPKALNRSNKRKQNKNNFRSEEDEEEEEEDPDIAKIKKVQSFFRGWLCRF